MDEILEGLDRDDPKALTELRAYRRNNEDYDMLVDVELENLIASAVSKKIEEGSEEDFKVLIIENLMMIYHDDELSTIFKMFKAGNKPIARANDWCRPHLEQD